ncbi:hypothetical protein FIBSPDRAFT_894339 [Athelia psychrophila]|uniref:F-box domain-containing protein n=1 Tax=Athelia psychrophila TaxID=1759441 RepID=A0A166G371_9AGAM|nr:hypothetical protein FIBSPDRAFT_894339 [Fibularhizoctonia sp. CBS 109695]
MWPAPAQDWIPVISTSQHPCGVANDTLRIILGHLSSSGDLFRCGLVNRQWTPLANAWLYRHVHLRRKEDVMKFYACLLLRASGDENRKIRGALVRTLRVELVERTAQFLAVRRNMEAYHRLGDILRHLSGLTRLLMEVYMGSKTHESCWIQTLAKCLPTSLDVFMIRLADGLRTFVDVEEEWANIIEAVPCANLVLISNRPIFYPEPVETRLPALLAETAPGDRRIPSIAALNGQRIEIWTSVHSLVMTPTLHVESIVYHTDVPGWDECYLYAAVWNPTRGGWAMEKAEGKLRSNLPEFTATRCLGATIDPLQPTVGTCQCPNHHNRWIVCDDGTICRVEHRSRPRRPSDWVLWENNTYGRRALGMLASLVYGPASWKNVRHGEEG